MPSPVQRPATIGEYIGAAARERQPHLRALYAILKSVAPQAHETIKWGNPFFVEPRFLFAFSAHKAHVSFAAGLETLRVFRDDLKKHSTTKNFLRIPYTESIPEDLIRKIATYRVNAVKERADESFW